MSVGLADISPLLPAHSSLATHQNTNSGVPTLSRSSQLTVTESPSWTCFSREPRMVARGLVTARRVTRVLIPVVVAA